MTTAVKSIGLLGLRVQYAKIQPESVREVKRIRQQPVPENGAAAGVQVTRVLTALRPHPERRPVRVSEVQA